MFFFTIYTLNVTVFSEEKMIETFQEGKEEMHRCCLRCSHRIHIMSTITDWHGNGHTHTHTVTTRGHWWVTTALLEQMSHSCHMEVSIIATFWLINNIHVNKQLMVFRWEFPCFSTRSPQDLCGRRQYVWLCECQKNLMLKFFLFLKKTVDEENMV